MPTIKVKPFTILSWLENRSAESWQPCLLTSSLSSLLPCYVVFTPQTEVMATFIQSFTRVNIVMNLIDVMASLIGLV